MIKQFVPQEVCLKCQGCCRFRENNSAWLPCLLDEEILDLVDRKDIPAVAISIDKKIQPVPNPLAEGFLCSLLDENANKCRIYSLRPFECQLYPFLINLRDGKVILTVDLNCPYVKENLSGKEFKEYTEYLVSYLNSPKQIRMLQDNPQVIQAYEEVLEIIELNITDEIK